MAEETIEEARRCERRVGEEMQLVVRATVRLLLPFILVFAMYIVSYGHLTPGGGFQGGMILVGGAMAFYLAHGYIFLRRFDQESLDLAEHAGILAFLFTGLMGLVFARTFLENILPRGQITSLLSAGTVPLLNAAVAFKVASGTLIVLLILVQALKRDEE